VVEERRKINSWLEDPEFLKNAEYPDKYYLESLCYHISSYLKNTPIPILTTLDNKYNRVFFCVGQDIKKSFHIDNQVNPYDFVTKVKEYMKQYYPKYSVIEEIEVELTEDEIIARVKNEGMDLNDAINFRVKTDYLEHGIIEKVFFVKDEFIINVNDTKSIRMAGTSKRPMSVSSFLKELKLIEDDKERKNYIFGNSTFIKNVEKERNRIDVAYDGKMMVSFWKINKKFIKEEPVKVDEFNYTWGKFNVKFNSALLKLDCMELFKKDETE